MNNPQALVEGINPQTLAFVDANTDKRTTLAQMNDGATARNNCYNAAHALSGNLVTQNQDAYVVGLVFNSAEHWASAVQTSETDAIVIDYTMRQFAAGAGVDETIVPFPFIGSYTDWKTTVEGWAAARWDETLVESVTEEVA